MSICSLKIQLLLLIIATQSVGLVSCGSSKKKDNPPPTLTETSPPVIVEKTYTVYTNVDSKVTSKKLPIQIHGVPLQYSNKDSLNLTFESSIPFKATIGITSGLKCESPESESTWQENPTNFSFEAIGTDGSYTLCIVLMGKSPTNDEQIIDPISIAWTKDTSIPTLEAVINGTLGPASFSGNEVAFYGSAADVGSSLTDVLYILERKSDSLCFQESSQSFVTSCTTQKTSGRESRAVRLPKQAFTVDGEYTLKISTADLAGNQSEEFSRSFNWDGTVPNPSDDLVASTDSAGIHLSWNSMPTGTQALLIRSNNTISNFTPESGVNYAQGEYVGDGQFVIYGGSASQYSDSAIENFMTYGYSLFFLDSSGNYSSPTTKLITYYPSTAFLGIEDAYLQDSNFNITANWRPYVINSSAPAEEISYNIFASTNPNSIFNNSIYTSTVGSSFLNFPWPQSLQSKFIYLATRSSHTNLPPDINNNILALNKNTGTFHRLVGGTRNLGKLGNEVFIKSPRALAVSKNGNYVFYSGNGVLNAICKENVLDAFCVGRETEKIHHLAGRDGFGDAANEEFAQRALLGDIGSAVFDTWGNLFFTDTKYFRIRAICFEVTHQGPCFLKKVGYLYNLIGTGAFGDGSSNTSLSSTSIGTPGGIALDNVGNIAIGDSTFYKIRIACFQSSGTLCTGTPQGSIVTIAGNGENRDPVEGIIVENATFGSPNTVQLDSSGNILFGDSEFKRIRVICRSSANGGSCNESSGRTVGRMYVLAGNGATGDASHGANAVASAIGNVGDMKLDKFSNLLFSDESFFRIRMLCLNSESSCNMNSGKLLRVYGQGLAADSANGSVLSTSRFGRPAKIYLDASDNIAIMDSQFRKVRLFCKNNESLCIGRHPDSIHNLVGMGNSQSTGDNIPALNAFHGASSAVATDIWGNIYWSDNLKFRIMALCISTSQGGFCQGKTSGRLYRVAGTGSSSDGATGTNALTAGIGESNGIALDNQGNVYWSDTTFRRIRAMCIDIVANGFCKDKVQFSSYRLAGQDAVTPVVDSATNSVAIGSGIGTPYAVAVDTKGNIYFSDTEFSRIRIVCFDVTSQGYCLGKIVGRMFRFAGWNVAPPNSGDGDDGALASSTSPVSAIGSVKGIAIDAFDNVYLADETKFRIRMICRSTMGNCSNGKTIGKIYWFAGNGQEGDGAHGANLVTPIGPPVGLALDSQGNLFVGDKALGRYRIRLVCKSIAGACSDKPEVDKIYRLAGNGQVELSPSNSSGTKLSIQSIGNAGVAKGTNDTVIFASPDSGIGMITSGAP